MSDVQIDDTLLLSANWDCSYLQKFMQKCEFIHKTLEKIFKEPFLVYYCIVYSYFTLGILFSCYWLLEKRKYQFLNVVLDICCSLDLVEMKGSVEQYSYQKSSNKLRMKALVEWNTFYQHPKMILFDSFLNQDNDWHVWKRNMTEIHSKSKTDLDVNQTNLYRT